MLLSEIITLPRSLPKLYTRHVEEKRFRLQRQLGCHQQLLCLPRREYSCHVYMSFRDSFRNCLAGSFKPLPSFLVARRARGIISSDRFPYVTRLGILRSNIMFGSTKVLSNKWTVNINTLTVQEHVRTVILLLYYINYIYIILIISKMCRLFALNKTCIEVTVNGSAAYLNKGRGTSIL
jgi:hypothetical protein